MFAGVISLVFLFKWMQKLPRSVTNLFGVMLAMFIIGLGIWWLKNQLFVKHSYN